MQAPSDCHLPAEGELRCWARADYAAGKWLLVDHTGKVKTSGALSHVLHERGRNRALQPSRGKHKAIR